MFPKDQIAAVKAAYPDISVAEEGKVNFLLIEKLKLPDGCNPRVVDALLCPAARDGYPSRLFLSQKISHRGPGQGWNPNHAVVILGRQWWAVSWKTDGKEKPLMGMIMDHIGAFRG
jgi:hypothetical protein